MHAAKTTQTTLFSNVQTSEDSSASCIIRMFTGHAQKICRIKENAKENALQVNWTGRLSSRTNAAFQETISRAFQGLISRIKQHSFWPLQMGTGEGGRVSKELCCHYSTCVMHAVSCPQAIPSHPCHRQSKYARLADPVMFPSCAVG
jgi:hypothetical protein